MKRIIAFFLTAIYIFTFGAFANVFAEETANFANVVVFAHFNGDGQENYFKSQSLTPPMTNAQKIKDCYDGDYGRSFTEYLKTVSNNKLRVKNYFPQMQNDGTIVPIELSCTKEQALSDNIDYTIIKEVLTNSVISGMTDNVDLNDDGNVDNITIMLVGESPDSSTGSGLPTLWPHQSNYVGNETINNKAVQTFNMLNTKRFERDESGLLIHEFLHSLGYPDLYRQGVDDYAVHTWDIMGASTKFVSRPLAYMTSHFSGWNDIDVVDSSGSYELPTANSALILKAPGNPQEFFVVESRVKGISTDKNSLDAGIGGTGMIVYRIDTTATNLSNSFGKTGVYIFRPQEGQSGYFNGDAKKTVQSAYLPYEGRNSIGTDNKTDTLSDGALTYTDGTNSRVEITNIVSDGNGKITFDVKIPKASEYDLWENTNLPSGDYVTTVIVDKIPYALVKNRNTAQLYRYTDGTWKVQGIEYSMCTSPNEVGEKIQLLELNGKLVMVYGVRNSDYYVKTINTAVFDISSNSWENGSSFTVPSGDEFNDFSAVAKGNDVYVNCLYDMYGKGSIAKFDGQSFTKIKDYHSDTGSMGDPMITTDGKSIYLSLRTSFGNKINIWKYDTENDNISSLKSPGDASPYTIEYYNGNLYCALSTNNGSKAVEIMKYDLTTYEWTNYAKDNIDCFKMELTVAQGNLYLVSKPAIANAGRKLYVYAISENKITQEGEPVATVSDTGEYGIVASDDKLFAYYVDENNTASVSSKTTVNRLLSLTITPPTKTSYEKGDKVSLDGIKVVANYVAGSKELTSSQYKVNDFDTNTAGEKTATVEFGGVKNTFPYTVFNKVYSVTEGANAVWEKGTNEGITIKTDGDIPMEIKVNGNAIDNENYSAENGTVTLKQSYLQALQVGKYTISITYSNGMAQTTFNIKAHEHSWSNEWKKTKTHHWHECEKNGCDITDDSKKDGYGQHKDEDSDGKCDECQYIVSVPSTPITMPSTPYIKLSKAENDKYAVTVEGTDADFDIYIAEYNENTLSTLRICSENENIDINNEVKIFAWAKGTFNPMDIKPLTFTPADNADVK